MMSLRAYLDRIEPNFHPGGKYQKFYALGFAIMWDIIALHCCSSPLGNRIRSSLPLCWESGWRTFAAGCAHRASGIFAMATMRAVHQAGWGGREQLSVRDVLPAPGTHAKCGSGRENMCAFEQMRCGFSCLRGTRRNVGLSAISLTLGL